MDTVADHRGDEGPAVPPADPSWVHRLAAVRPEPDADGQPPTAADLEQILATAMTVPDHGNLEPWRFAVCMGTGRDRFAGALVAGLLESKGPDLPDVVVAKMRKKAYAAPCSVMLIASPDPTSNVEVWEQVASASCTGYAVVLAATGLGYGAVWKSARVVNTAPVRALFGLREHESMLGWVNLGTAAPLTRKKLTVAPGIDALHDRVLRFDG